MYYLYYPGSSIARIIAYRVRKRVRSALLYWRDRLRSPAGYAQLRALRGTARGRNAFVFANGPSVQLLDPVKVKNTGFDIFATNGFLWSEFSRVAVPTHYVLSDPACFSLQPEKMSEEQREISRLYVPLLEKIHASGMTLFMPMEQWSVLRGTGKAVGFCDIENEFSDNAADVTRPRGYWPLTAYKALAVANYLGYDKVYICGFDNDYFLRLEVDAQNRLYYGDKHFFDAGKKRDAAKYSDCAGVGEYLYEQHFVFTQLAKFPASRVVNLDKQSLATCFPKSHELDLYK
jgi:hypothetical protein